MVFINIQKYYFLRIFLFTYFVSTFRYLNCIFLIHLVPRSVMFLILLLAEHLKHCITSHSAVKNTVYQLTSSCIILIMNVWSTGCCGTL